MLFQAASVVQPAADARALLLVGVLPINGLDPLMLELREHVDAGGGKSMDQASFAAIYVGKQIIASTVMGEQSITAAGLPTMAADAQNAVQRRGATWIGPQMLAGQGMVVGHKPILDGTGRPVGTLRWACRRRRMRH